VDAFFGPAAGPGTDLNGRCKSRENGNKVFGLARPVCKKRERDSGLSLGGPRDSVEVPRI
jgi:hypothetical protein